MSDVLKTATDLHLSGQHEASLKTLQQVVNFQSDPLALTLASKVTQQLGDYDSAVEYASSAVTFARSGNFGEDAEFEALLTCATALFFADRDQESLNAIQQAESLVTKKTSSKDRCRLLLIKGDVLEFLHRHHEARVVLSTAAAKHDIPVDIHIEIQCRLANSLTSLGHDNESLAALELAADLAHRHYVPSRLRCGTYRQLADFLRAKGQTSSGRWYRLAVQEISGEPAGAMTQFSAAINFARWLSENQKPKSSAIWYSRSLKIAVNGALGRRALNRYVDQLMEGVDPAVIMPAVLGGLQTDDGLTIAASDRFNATCRLSEVLIDNDHECLAEDLLQQLVHPKVQNGLNSWQLATCRLYLGESLAAQQKNHEAKPHLVFAVKQSEILKDRGLQFDAFFALGEVLGNLHEFEAAQQTMGEAAMLATLTSDPRENLCNAVLSLAETSVQRGRLLEAMQRFEYCGKLAESHNVRNETRFNIAFLHGSALFEQFQHNAAVAKFQAAKRISDESSFGASAYCSVRLEIARLFFQQGQVEQATNLLEDVRERIDAGESVGPLVACSFHHVCCESPIVRSQALVWVWHANEAVRLASQIDAPLMRLNASTKLLRMAANVGDGETARKQAEYVERILGDASVSPLSRCNSLLALADYHIGANSPGKAIARLAEARDRLASVLTQIPWQTGVSGYSSAYRDLYAKAFMICERQWQTNVDDDSYLWMLLSFLDSRRCAFVREASQGLRRDRSPGEHPKTQWRPNGKEIGLLFSTTGESTVEIRDESVVVDSLQYDEIEIPEQRMSAEASPVAALDRRDVDSICDDERTVIIQFHFAGDDLVVIPVRRIEGVVRILVDKDRFHSIPNIREELEQLVTLHQLTISHCFSARQQIIGGSGLGIERQMGDLKSELYAQINQNLNFDHLLETIEPDSECRKQLRVIFLLDGPLFQLPLHAAYSERCEKFLVDQVASIQYTLSLRALMNRRDASISCGIRGVFMGNAIFNDRCLANVANEAQQLENAMPGDWMFYGNSEPSQANRSNLMKIHRDANMVWFAGHGGPVYSAADAENRNRVVGHRPAIFLQDGPLQDAEMLAESFDFGNLDLLFLSCCTLGRLNAGKTHGEVEGFQAVMAMLGCRRTISALWPLWDESAAQFAGCFGRALGKASVPSADFSFSAALSDAISSFRKLNSGQFDHPIYWAPYVLYGSD